jgi:hypothetical protein
MMLCCACWAGSARDGYGQTGGEQALLPARAIGSADPVPPIDIADWEQRRRALHQWMDDYAAWKKWHEKWGNRIEPGWLGARPRRPRPEPPAWLAGECPAPADDEPLVVEACELLAEWRDEGLAQVRRQTATARIHKEAPTHTQWWEHLHVDALWMMTQWGTPVYGVVGMHATLEIAGRLQVFVAPGVMLLNLPGIDGTREWKPATDWGFAYRLVDFKFPGSKRQGSLHVNVAKAWVLSGPSNLFNTSIDLAGFSITPKQIH